MINYFVVFKQETAYEMRISDWSSDVCSSDLGLQIGGEVKEVVFVMMSDKAVDAMLSSEFKLGADASVTVGPIGRGIEASRSTDLTSDIYAFSQSVGLFGGGALVGAKIFTCPSPKIGRASSGDRLWTSM